jgi:DNA-binding transcriptional MerR regulator
MVEPTAHLSIGEVLNLLQSEFPDVTISKIRFLESQGLLDPERTPSGYRRFYPADLDRLRWILTQQKENFLPLKVIKERLADRDAGRPMEHAESAAGSGADHGGPPRAEAGQLRLGDDGPGTAPAASTAETSRTAQAEHASDRYRTHAANAPEGEPIWMADAARAKAGRNHDVNGDQPTPLDRGPTTVSLSLGELAQASGLEPADVRELERFGLLEGRSVGSDVFYDGDGLVIAQKSAAFFRHGIEPRHLRLFKTTADREAAFLEQVVMPMLKQRNPAARREAVATLGELAALGQALREAMLRTALREHLT